MYISTKYFEEFLLDGGVYSPDMYVLREHEDFSPEGAFGVEALGNRTQIGF